MDKIKNLEDVLRLAHIGRYAVGAFSPRYTQLIEPIMMAAIKMKSPVIIQISEKELYRHEIKIKNFTEEFYRAYEKLKPSVPVVLHLDHTKEFDIIKQAIVAGFTSVMIDASEFDFKENVEITKKVVDYAHPLNITVEAELGKIGTTDFVETSHDEELFTDSKEAAEFCKLTNVDALAVSVGTAHGVYTVRKPRIDYDRLEAINKLVSRPLVLHGGSGVPREMIIKSVQMEAGGVSKVNIATDVEQAMLKVLNKTTHLTDEELNSYPKQTLEKCKEAVYNLVIEKMKHYILSTGKA